jgi:hypothetical protein
MDRLRTHGDGEELQDSRGLASFRSSNQTDGRGNVVAVNHKTWRYQQLILYIFVSRIRRRKAYQVIATTPYESFSALLRMESVRLSLS